MHGAPDGQLLAHVPETDEVPFTIRSKLRVTPFWGKQPGPVKLPVSVKIPADVGTWVLMPNPPEE
jgi:hypothetical protein